MFGRLTVGWLVATLLVGPVVSVDAHRGAMPIGFSVHVVADHRVVDPHRHVSSGSIGRSMPRLAPQAAGRTSTGGSPPIAMAPKALISGSAVFGQGTSFPGLAAGCPGCEPPDPWIGVSPTQIVQVVNTTVRISDRTGTKINEFAMGAIFSEPANQYEDTDPHIVWDAAAGRWIATAISFDASCAAGHLYVSVSRTADANGSWNTNRWDYPGEVPDYPMLGYSTDKVAVGINRYALDPLAPGCWSSYNGASLLVADLAPLLSGATVSSNETTEDPTVTTWQPAKELTGDTTIYAVRDTTNGNADDVGQVRRLEFGAGKILLPHRPRHALGEFPIL